MDLFVLYVFVKRFFFSFVYYFFLTFFSIKFELITNGFFLGVMAISGSFFECDVIRAYVLRGLFDVF